MLTILSPAKKLDFSSPVRTTLATEPKFPQQTAALVEIMQRQSAADIAKLMKLSDSLAELNFNRYANWQTSPSLEYARQAILAFNGDVYEGLLATELNDKQLAWAQDHLAILSGLYGVLAPLDLIQPYRLEMGTKLKNSKGKDLYNFWGSQIAAEINARISASKGDQILLNLASNEYFKSVDTKTLKFPVVECVFQEEKNGDWKIVSFYAKKARGLMARYITDNKINSVDKITAFDAAGYKFTSAVSTAEKLIFRRKA